MKFARPINFFSKEFEVDEIHPDKLVKMTDMGHIKEVMSVDKLSFEAPPITKLSQDLYMLKHTGEVREYDHTENRSENVKSLSRTFKRIRQIINYNFGGRDNELAFTLTYAENMTNPQRLYDDFKKFFMRLRYQYGQDIDYFSVVEPQGRGAWHCHVLLRFNAVEKIFIPNKEIAELWGQGFVTVKAINKNVDNLGAYLSAYLGDIELTPENEKVIAECCPGEPEQYELKTAEVDGVQKKFIKGGRLHLYPTGMNIYRKSRGIKVPESTYMPYKDAKKVVGSATPNYSSTLCVLDDNGTELNRITYEQYNLKRKNSQEGGELAASEPEKGGKEPVKDETQII